MRNTDKGLLLIAFLIPLLLTQTVCSGPNGNPGDTNQDLLEAAMKGDTAAVKTLLTKGADVNAQNQAGGTALMYAATVGHNTTVQALLEAGADVNAKDNEGGTALMRAARNGQMIALQASAVRFRPWPPSFQ